jgi:triosephosphate isomerase
MPMSKTNLIAANWKMNPTPLPLEALRDKSCPYQTHANVDVVVFPTFLDISACVDAQIVTGAQYGCSEEKGAHTGDICMEQIAASGCHYVLCGHSERRKDHGETNADVAVQVTSALESKLHPILCVGETEQERDAGKEKDIVKAQLSGIPLESTLTIAYEPVWAIGTGKTATPEQAQEMHAYIRSLLPEDRRDDTRILYGGSMKPDNAEELLAQPDIDGGLIGGASLKPDRFGQIVEIASK